MIPISGKYTTAKIMIDYIEDSAMSQVVHFVNHPAFTNPISIMPDVHAGKGSVIGFTMPLTPKIIPNVVGVDIGCGILSINIGKNLPISLENLDRRIRQRIPFGIDIHEDPVIKMEKEFPWQKANTLARKFIMAYHEIYGQMDLVNFDMRWFLDKSESIGGNMKRMINSIGTTGSGNHYIETGIDQDGNYWITIHTGSRNFGKRICEYWQGKAEKFLRVDRKSIIQDEIKKLKETVKDGRELFERIKELKAQQAVQEKPGIDMKGCEWLEGQDASGYLYDMIFAQVYAEVNRQYIASTILDIIGVPAIDSIETVHNFIDFRDFIIRKGAIRSYIGERMCISLNMRDGILVCTGKSNPEFNFSAPHGLGRFMSRGQAKKNITVETFVGQMQGIYSTSVGQGTLDEAPDAYKNPMIIEEAIGPTADIINRIRPIHNMKDSEGRNEELIPDNFSNAKE